jgi:excisionase family DNA binding protein
VSVSSGPGSPSTDDRSAAVLSVDEAARFLRADRKTIYGAIERGELPALKLGRRLFVSRAVLDRLLNGEHP